MLIEKFRREVDFCGFSSFDFSSDNQNRGTSISPISFHNTYDTIFVSISSSSISFRSNSSQITFCCVRDVAIKKVDNGMFSIDILCKKPAIGSEVYTIIAH